MNKKVTINNYLFEVYSKMLFPCFAPHITANVKKEEVLNQLKQNKCYLLRYTSNFDKTQHTDFWYIIKDTFIPLEKFSSNTRNQVKKGLKNCYVKKVDLNFIKENCYDIYKSALVSYNQDYNSEVAFKNNSFDDENRDFWVVFSQENNTPIAYASCLIQNNTCNYTYIKYHPDYLNLYPSYALHYEMDSYYLDEKKLNYVNVGAKSIAHETNVQDFLIQKFKYRKGYCDLAIIYRPDIKLLVTVLYPFRKLIKKLPKTGSLNALLTQHELFKNTSKA